MAYDKRLNKSDRNAIKKARRVVKATGFRESEKYLNALQSKHVSTVVKVDEREYERV